MGKLLLLDIDGTLLDSHKKLPEATLEALEAARSNGHELAIATGRAPFMFTKLREQLGIDTFISINGQFIVHKGKTIHQQAIDPALLMRLTKFAEAEGHPLVYMNDERMVSTVDFHPHIGEGINSLKFPYPPMYKDFHLHNPVYQTLVFCTQEEEKEYEKNFENLQFVRWHRVSCDVLPAGGTKASGIKRLIEATGHSIEDTIAFGDGLNDLQMMEVAGFSVAMGNGHEKTKQKAGFVAEHVDNDGLSKAFKYLQLI